MLGVKVFAAEGTPSAITIDYPKNESIFPPEITPPTFIWRDAAPAANRWQIEVHFSDGSTPLRVDSLGHSDDHWRDR